MREPSTPCTVEHRLRPPHFYLAEPVGRRSNAQNPLWATGQTPFRAAYRPRGSPYPENCTRPSHLSPKNNACEKCGLKAIEAARQFGWATAAASFLELYEQLKRLEGDEQGLPTPAFCSTQARGFQAAMMRAAAQTAKRGFQRIEDLLLLRSLHRPRDWWLSRLLLLLLHLQLALLHFLK